ncbi:hypothetical protein [Tepidimonas charontis]|uniref:hypothetical protein n=1 Tax=Tepidimonas charontis TaxID=2267262 RepID=UPI001186CDBA|nr:hypothetical protein [Tepidimonas charontis]
MAAQRIVWIAPEAPPKPALGAPCNGCGVCCLLEPCPVGVLLSRRRRGPCVALRWMAAERRYRCGALSVPATVFGWGDGRLGRCLTAWARPLLARWIGAGRGCDCDWTPA